MVHPPVTLRFSESGPAYLALGGDQRRVTRTVPCRQPLMWNFDFDGDGHLLGIEFMESSDVAPGASNSPTALHLAGSDILQIRLAPGTAHSRASFEDVPGVIAGLDDAARVLVIEIEMATRRLVPGVLESLRR